MHIVPNGLKVIASGLALAFSLTLAGAGAPAALADTPTQAGHVGPAAPPLLGLGRIHIVQHCTPAIAAMGWVASQSNLVREVDVNGNCFTVYGKVRVDYSTLTAQSVETHEVTAGAEGLFSDISVGWDYLDPAICAGDLVFVTATDETTGKSVKQQASCP